MAGPELAETARPWVWSCESLPAPNREGCVWHSGS